MSFPRYPAYKDSGVPWFGEVPKHWHVAPLKAFIDRIESGVSVNATDTPAESEQFGVLKTSCVYTGQFDAAENKAVVNAEYDRVACPVVANTLIVSRMNTPDLVGAAGLTRADHPTLFLPDRLWQVFPKGIRADFLYFWTRTASYRAQVEMACAGTSSSMQNLGQDDFRSFMFVSPPPDEQAGIAHFLDRETAKIDALVTEQEQLITLLKEKRQAVISHAVTKGLGPSVPMKDSGVEWLGEVPAHWQVNRLQRVVKPGTSVTYGIVQAGPDVEDGVPYIRTSDMSGDELPLDGYPKTSPEIDASYARSRVSVGDLVIAIRATVGKCLPVPKQLDGANLTQGTARIAPGPDTDPGYLLAFLTGNGAQTYFDRMAKGATFREITLEVLRKAPVLIPPLEEQDEIARWVTRRSDQFLALIREAKQAQNLLLERRSALISAAVTGQIDVRNLEAFHAA
ncbi:restriction endonuclease subunit S [Ideonella sp. B508-1]|uniref:restriction endonuclease subunit S n=1 Tax=Ideonella sp. B508-1 TaxID=137716 RepID=UPI0003B69A5C|nr:restriction endonuclease subunit S [Ideonella sp. B508-1]